jgi:hypothetical protein
VIERHSTTPAVKTMLTVPCFTFHHVNAFETEGGQRIILDSIPWRSLDFSSNLENLGVRPSSGEALGWETLIVDFPSGAGYVPAPPVPYKSGAHNSAAVLARGEAQRP